MTKEVFPWNVYGVKGRDTVYPFNADTYIPKKPIPQKAFQKTSRGEGIDFQEEKRRIPRIDEFHRMMRLYMTKDLHTMHSDDDYYSARRTYLHNILFNEEVYNIPVRNAMDLEDVALFMHHYNFSRKTPSGIEKDPKFRVSSKSNHCIEADNDIPNFLQTMQILEKKFDNISVEEVELKKWNTRICNIDWRSNIDYDEKVRL